MTLLKHLMEAPFECGPEDVNFVAFVNATSIIRGHDVMEEFLACGLWPLSENFGFQVERKESTLSKVMVPMPHVNLVIGVLEPGVAFNAWIVNATNLLVGKYSITEHNVCKGLRGR
jgi:hypothetical protein